MKLLTTLFISICDTKTYIVELFHNNPRYFMNSRSSGGQFTGGLSPMPESLSEGGYGMGWNPEQSDLAEQGEVVLSRRLGNVFGLNLGMRDSFFRIGQRKPFALSSFIEGGYMVAVIKEFTATFREVDPDVWGEQYEGLVVPSDSGVNNRLIGTPVVAFGIGASKSLGDHSHLELNLGITAASEKFFGAQNSNRFGGITGLGCVPGQPCVNNSSRNTSTRILGSFGGVKVSPTVGASINF